MFRRNTRLLQATALAALGAGVPPLTCPGASFTQRPDAAYSALWARADPVLAPAPIEVSGWRA